MLMFGVGAADVQTMTKARQEVPHVMIVGGENHRKCFSAARGQEPPGRPGDEDFTNQIVEKRFAPR